MPTAPLSLVGIDFTYPSLSTPLFRDLSLNVLIGFTGVAGANGAGKSTLLQIAAGVLQPDSGVVVRPGKAVYCAQRTDAPPADFQAFLDDTGGHVYALRDRFGIEWDWLERWHTLSHGERKRAQIACALWQEPTVLALDEPTNHIDHEGRRLLLDVLSEFRGIGLIVSHDREVLDELCYQCLWVDSGSAQVYAGGYSQMQETRAIESETMARVRDKAVRQRDAIKREEVARREQSLRAHRARSKRRLDRKDHSAKAAINARINTDSKDGNRLRQIEGRVKRAEAAVAGAQVRKRRRVGIELPGAVCKRDFLFRIEGGELGIGGGRVLHHPKLQMRPVDRIAVMGPNGSGKSSVLAFVRDHLNIEPEHVIYLPQEISVARGAEILAQVKELPKDRLGQAMQVIDRLGSNPSALLDSEKPSPGELRKLLIAQGMTQQPYLMILDEPTNHMDLPSIEALESALADCVCGLLLVSHDAWFLRRLTTMSWTIDTRHAAVPNLVIRSGTL